MKTNCSVYVLRADTCKHCIFFFFVQFDKYMNYKALSMYKPECHSLYYCSIYTDHERWGTDVSGPAIKLFYFKLEENKGAI